MGQKMRIDCCKVRATREDKKAAVCEVLESQKETEGGTPPESWPTKIIGSIRRRICSMATAVSQSGVQKQRSAFFPNNHVRYRK